MKPLLILCFSSISLLSTAQEFAPLGGYSSNSGNFLLYESENNYIILEDKLDHSEFDPNNIVFDYDQLSGLYFGSSLFIMDKDFSITQDALDQSQIQFDHAIPDVHFKIKQTPKNNLKIRGLEKLKLQRTLYFCSSPQEHNNIHSSINFADLMTFKELYGCERFSSR